MRNRAQHTLADDARGEPQRAAIITALEETPDGLGADDLARRTGLHPNTVRWHLGHLADAGLVRARRVHTGRPGRPRLVFESVSDSRPGAGYRLLATMLAHALADADPASTQTWLTGCDWGRRVVEGHTEKETRDAVECIVALLEEQDFEPRRTPEGIEMRRCPFADVVDAQGPTVCALHAGFIAGALEALDAGVRLAALERWVRPGVCVARFASAA